MKEKAATKSSAEERLKRPKSVLGSLNKVETLVKKLKCSDQEKKEIQKNIDEGKSVLELMIESMAHSLKILIDCEGPIPTEISPLAFKSLKQKK